jgi:putative tryptophan/tyrosine transport system substrate-binding protein
MTAALLGQEACSLIHQMLAIAPRAARFVDEILKWTTPGDLAAELSMDYRPTVNLKTARELGITIPPAVLARASEVIE